MIRRTPLVSLRLSADYPKKPNLLRNLFLARYPGERGLSERARPKAQIGLE